MTRFLSNLIPVAYLFIFAPAAGHSVLPALQGGGSQGG